MMTDVTTRYIVLVLLVLVSLSSLEPSAIESSQSETDYPHAYPRDGVIKRFENERVIVWEVLWLNGISQPFHRHQYDMTGVFLRWGPLRVTRLDGTFTVSDSPFEVPSVFLLRKGVTHKEEGIGTPERHSIMIDLKDFHGRTYTPRTDIPVAFDGLTAKLDEDRVRIWDITLENGQELPLHVHNYDTVAVFLQGGTVRIQDEDGTESTDTWTYKDVRLWPAGLAHSEVVVDGSPRAMIYELLN